MSQRYRAAMPEALPVAATRWGSIPPLVLTSLARMAGPGPATISLAGVGPVFGVRHSLKYLIGIIVGTMVVLVSDPMNVKRLARTTFAPQPGF